MIYLIFYLSFFLIQSRLANWIYKNYYYTNKSLISKLFLLLVAAFPLIFISSIRYEVGTDFNNYIDMFKYLYNRNFSLNVNVEIGWILFNRICYFFYDNIQILFISSSLLFGIVSMYAIMELSKINENNSIALIVFIYNCFLYPVSLNIIRQSIAAAIIFLSIIFVVKKKSFSFLFCVTIATTFHYSACLFYILYFFALPIYRPSKKTIVLILTIIASLFLIQKISIIISIFPFLQKYSKYINTDNDFKLINNLIMKCPIFLGPIVWSILKKDDNHFSPFAINSAMLCILFLIYSKYFSYFYRLLYYLYGMQIIMIEKICECFKPRLIIKWIYVIYGIYYFYSSTYLSGGNGIIPYQTFWRI